MRPVSPFLRWAGSKRQLISELLRYWNSSYKRYVEPFAGSACFFFQVCPDNALLGDINAHLVDMYIQVRDNHPAVAKALGTMERSEEKYYHVRSLDPKSLHKEERAARFIYLNRLCFNGLYRTNKDGEFNVPYGGRRSGKIPDASVLESCSNALQNANLIKGDFADVLDKVTAGDFVYVDPPYKVENKRVFNEYDPSSFTIEDLNRLRNYLDTMDNDGAAFLASYADCEESKILSEGYYVERVQVRRNMAGFSGNRRMASELLISNRRP